jgi:penicillin-binding protein 1A
MSAAGREYFGKDVADLTIEEAAAIAVALRNPTQFDMRRFPELVKNRRDIVIRLMVSNGFITQDEADAAIAQPVDPIPHETVVEEAPQVRIEAIRQLLNDPEFSVLGLTSEDREVAIFGCPAESIECEEQAGLKGGLIITTTVDMGLQREANQLLRTWLPVPEDGAKAPTGAITTIDNNTGAIKVMASGLDFGTDFEAGERTYDLATEGLRQPGSSFKPFALMAYLESGGSINSYWSSQSPLALQCSVPCGPGGRFVWTVRGGGGGLTRLFEATYRSINTVYAQVALATGPERIADMANRLGIESELPLVYSLALGAGEVTPLEMAAAYSTLARYGDKVEPHLIQSITTKDGEVLYEHEVTSEQVTDPALAATVVEAMRNVTRGTAPKANIGRPMAGKTGTTQSFRDAWFVGFVPQFTSSVWVGYADEQIAMRNVQINGRTYSRVFGGDVPAPMWKEFMTILLADVPEENFAPLPPGTNKYKVVPSTTVPSVISLLQDDAEDAIYLAHLNVAIVEVNAYEAQGVVVNQIPAAGAKMTQGNAVTIEVSTGLPPEIPMPNVINLTLTQANQVLITTAENTGISITLQPTFVESPDEETWNKIIQTQPGPGTAVATGDTITAIIGKPPPPDPEDE